MPADYDQETGEILPTAPSVIERRPSAPSPYQSVECGQIAAAIAKMQGEMEPPKRTKTAKIRGTARSGSEYEYSYAYAPLEEVTRCMRDAMAKNALAWQQGLVTRGGEYFIRTYIRHSSGEWTCSDYPVITDKSGPQGFAAGVTYARRYGLTLAAGIAAEDDDDGAAAQTASEGAGARARATKANPAVAQPSAFEDRAREAYRRLAAAEKSAENSGGLLDIYDPVLDEWGSEDAALLEAGTPAQQKALDALRRKIITRLAENEITIAGAAYANA